MTRTIVGKAIRIPLALAVGGLAASAQASDDQAEAAPQIGVFAGLPPLYGDSPEKKGVDLGLNFNPTYYSVVYLKFQPNAGLTAKHAYFLISGGTDNVDCAIEYLISEREDVRCQPYPKPEGYVGPNAPPPKNTGPIVRNLDGFAFGSQQRIYIFVDNTNVQFSENTPVSFTPYGANDDVDKMVGVTRHDNWSFYDATFISLASGRHVLTMNNYCRGKDKKEIPAWPNANSAHYAVNFNLRMCRDGIGACDFTNPDHVIPLVIDPDTGNGWGSRP